MIKVKAIFIDNTATPSEENKLEFGNHFDGENFYFFESDEERIEFLKNLEKNWVMILTPNETLCNGN